MPAPESGYLMILAIAPLAASRRQIRDYVFNHKALVAVASILMLAAGAWMMM